MEDIRSNSDVSQSLSVSRTIIPCALFPTVSPYTPPLIIKSSWQLHSPKTNRFYLRPSSTASPLFIFYIFFFQVSFCCRNNKFPFKNPGEEKKVHKSLVTEFFRFLKKKNSFHECIGILGFFRKGAYY